MISTELSKSDFLDAVSLIGCEEAVIKSIIEVESIANGFMANQKPQIWFHRDVFSRKTNGKYDTEFPNLSNPLQGGYSVLEDQHHRLDEAMLLDKEAALLSTSWGRFQLMGYNYILAGYNSLQDFINAMYKSEREHFKAFVRYLKNLSLDQDLRNKDWKAFAIKYKNVENINDFVVSLKDAYAKYNS